MIGLSGSGPRHGKGYTYGWTTFFFAVLFLVIGGLYYITKQVDYTWRWYQVPKYFYYQDNIETRAEIEGEVASVNDSGGKIHIVVKGDGESETYTLPEGSDVKVSPRDSIYMGDVLGSTKQWKPGLMLQGLWITLKVSLISIVFGILLGLFTGLARMADNPALRWAAITYIELIRGSPLLVQIFIWYFVFGTLVNNLLNKYGLGEIPTMWFGVVSLALFAGAYVAEIVRAGIQSVHRGQMEAARSLGMSTALAMRKIILPQAFRRILPPLAGQFISLIKDSSLLGIIAIRELTKATREAVTTSLQPFEFWFTCAALYLVLTFALSLFVQYLERRTAEA